MRIRLLLAIVVLCATFGTIHAQELEGNLNFHSFIDNREYANSHRFSETIFGVRFSPEIGLRIDSVHRLRVGFNALHEFGSPKFTREIAPVIYYQYSKKNLDFYIGAFPRQGLISDFPRAIFNDTLNYYRPNIEGMAMKYETANFREVVFIDWTSRQTETARENFIFGFSGTFKKDVFFASHYVMMLHNAGPAVEIPGDHVEDNGAAAIKVGVDLSHRTFLDSLTINTGGLMSLHRIRGTEGGWQTPKGALFEITAEYRRIGITNSYYIGEANTIKTGDRFYDSKRYNRLDFTWRPRLYKNIEARLAFSLHFVDGVIDNQQSFGLRYNLAGSKSLKRRQD